MQKRMQKRLVADAISSHSASNEMAQHHGVKRRPRQIHHRQIHANAQPHSRPTQTGSRPATMALPASMLPSGRSDSTDSKSPPFKRMHLPPTKAVVMMVFAMVFCIASVFVIVSISNDNMFVTRSHDQFRQIQIRFHSPIQTRSTSAFGAQKPDSAAGTDLFSSSSLRASSTPLSLPSPQSKMAGNTAPQYKLNWNPWQAKYEQIDWHELQKTTTNKTLVVIIGNLRGGPLAWETLQKQVLDINPNTDLALMIGDQEMDHAPSSAAFMTNHKSRFAASSLAQDDPASMLFQAAKYVWTFPEFDDWADAMDIVDPTQRWEREVLPLMINRTGLIGGVRDFKGSGSIIFMARWYAMQHILHFDLLREYDRFVITRSDHYYKCAHDLSQLDPNYIWVPKGEDYSGLTDRHAVVPRELVLPALDLMHTMLHHPPPCTHFPKRRFKFHFACRIRLNPEQWIEYQWDRAGLLPYVRRMDRVMFTCATQNDTTRWQEATDVATGGASADISAAAIIGPHRPSNEPPQEFSEPPPQGLLLKYVKEYEMSLATCGRRHT